jgi:DNA-binding response OmpR family regulator
MSKILVVDDDRDFVEAVQLHLQRAGHTVEVACDRPEGMRLARQGHFDLLILDVMMTDMDDGIVMAQELRREGLEVPILMMSGISKATGMAYDKDAEITPATEFLEKPVKPETLIARVNALLNP